MFNRPQNVWAFPFLIVCVASGHTCLWGRIGGTITGYTCHDVAGSFVLGTQLLLQLLGSKSTERAHIWKLGKGSWLLIGTIAPSLLIIRP